MRTLIVKKTGVKLLVIGLILILVVSIVPGYGSKASAGAPGVNYLVSQDAAGVYANGPSQSGDNTAPRLSHDGKYVAFGSTASNIIPNDTNGYSDVFRKDTQTGAVALISVSPSGAQFTNNSYVRDMSYDGRYVLFAVMPSGVLFVRDTTNNTTEPTSDSSGPCYVSSASGGAISADGRYVTYSDSPYQGDPYQAVLKDMVTGTCRILSADTSGNVGNANSPSGSISCDGGIISFYTNSTNLPAGAGGYIAQFDTSGNLVLTKMAAIMTPYSTVSCNGNIIATWTTNGAAYTINRLTGQIITLGSYHGISSSQAPVSLSDDGRYAAITTNQDLDSAYPNTGAYNNYDVYVIDTKNSTSRLVSFTVAGNRSGSVFSSADISADGNKVTYGYLTPASTDITHELISGMTSGSTNYQYDVYTSETGF